MKGDIIVAIKYTAVNNITKLNIYQTFCGQKLPFNFKVQDITTITSIFITYILYLTLYLS